MEKEIRLNLIYNYILKDCSNKDRILYYKNKFAVFENKYIELIWNIHEIKEIKYLEVNKTVFIIRKSYIFLIYKMWLRNSCEIVINVKKRKLKK